MGDRKYSKEHCWVTTDGNIATIGLAPAALRELGEITDIAIDGHVGAEVSGELYFGGIFGMDANADLIAPVSGPIVEINPAIAKDPRLVENPDDASNWLIRVKLSDVSELDNLLSSAAYAGGSGVTS